MTEQHYTHTTIQTPAGEVNIHQMHVNQTIPNQNEEIIDVEANYTSNNRGMIPVDPKDMPSTYALPIADEEDPVAIPVPSQTVSASTDIVAHNYADVEVIEPSVPHVEQPIALPDNHLMNVKGEQVNLGNVGFMATTVGKVEII